MGNNLKISDLPIASRIDDDALVVLVQDHSNKVVTVSELSDKINERQNHTIDSLWHELKRATGMETVKALTNSLANHEYRIDGIEKLNGKQDAQMIALTKATQDLSMKSSKHEGDIRLLRTANIENRRSLAYLNCRVDAQIEKSDSYFGQISQLAYDLQQATAKHEADLAYTYEYVKNATDSAYAYASYYIDSTYANSLAYTSEQVDNNWAYTYSAYAYLATYVHYGCNEYWGGIKNMDDLYGGFEDNFVGEIKDNDNTSSTPSQGNKKCTEGCTC